jgi:hypothetical protein
MDGSSFEVFMLAFLFLAVALAVRFLPHTFHFTPVGAALLFFGAKQDRKWMWLPVLAFAASDVALDVFVYHYPVGWETIASASWYVMAMLIGGLLKKDGGKFKLGHIAGASLAGSVSFFIISNFATWAAYNMYPHNLAGLGACYVAAIPFFTPTLSSDMLYTIAFFGVPHLIEAVKKHGEMGSDDIAAA